MGMFDTLYDANAKIKCKHCNNENTFEIGAQSKQFGNTLSAYHVGDIIPDVSDSNDSIIEDNEWCDSCGKKIILFFAFKRGIFVGIYDSKEKSKTAIETFDIYAEYNKVFFEKEKFKQKTNILEYRIKAAIKFHGGQVSQQIFNSLFSFHYNFMDYDIIQTLKNILTMKG